MSRSKNRRRREARRETDAELIAEADAIAAQADGQTANKVILLGNVGSDPDVRITSAGVKRTAVSLATTRGTGAHDPEERTEWHRIHLWGRLAQFAEDYVTKGDKLYVVGSLRYGSYERDGLTIPTAEVWVSELVLLTPAR